MKHSRIIYVAQAIAAALLLYAASMKLMGTEESRMIFARLDMEPVGRYLIALIELTAAFLLLSPAAATGSVLAVGVMCGAIIAHLTRLGLEVSGDGGMMFGTLVVVLLCSGFVMIARRHEIPVVGDTFRG